MGGPTTTLSLIAQIDLALAATRSQTISTRSGLTIDDVLEPRALPASQRCPEALLIEGMVVLLWKSLKRNRHGEVDEKAISTSGIFHLKVVEVVEVDLNWT